MYPELRLLAKSKKSKNINKNDALSIYSDNHSKRLKILGFILFHILKRNIILQNDMKCSRKRIKEIGESI